MPIFPSLFIGLWYPLWLIVTIDAFLWFVFAWQWLRGRGKRYPLVLKVPSFKVAVFIPVYNEDPELVKGTIRSVKAALRGRGDIYLLDDSTDKSIRDRLRGICSELGVIYVHRGIRREFKAGALNYCLWKFGYKYEYVAVFDADQRPAENFFDVVMSFFSKGVGFVQAPQLYSELKSPMAKASWYQQLPFLKAIMRGRSGSSAFSLGSGTVFKTSALLKIGGFVEVLTEDLATSIKIHELGLKSIYIDAELLWYGEPPATAAAYITQQTRWAFGSFQTLPMLLKSKLPLPHYIDYLAGILYWLRIGILRFLEIALSPLFASLVFPEFFILYYIILFSYFIFYNIIMKKIGETYSFILHKGAEYVASIAAASAFLAWCLKRKMPFKVTPKRGTKRCVPCAFL
ncbi:glycosyltransferase family 2 protein [Pyrobaculum aerophilum]|uniref:glycosyltransferase family 2 protein n=2 Tax=Pyrobaculum aerophilum TaxID=13773 RepID=UPI0015F25ABC|nr:glycosyltransferase [Pyrobaculum aerophilum]